MTISHLSFLKKNNFEKQLTRLEKKLKDKRIVIYGIGSFFQTIATNYNLKNLNIVAVSDRTISENSSLLGYPSCPFSSIKDYTPDYILVGTLNYIYIIEELEKKLGKNIPIYPLAKKGIVELWEEIWG